MDAPFYEKKCSRCNQFSWDSVTGSYKQKCPKDGKPCDTNGGTYKDGELQ